MVENQPTDMARRSLVGLSEGTESHRRYAAAAHLPIQTCTEYMYNETPADTTHVFIACTDNSSSIEHKHTGHSCPGLLKVRPRKH